MTSRAAGNAEATFGAERLRYVTRRFQALQGLTWVALGAMMLLIRLEDLHGDGWSDLAWLLFWLTFATTVHYIPNYYRRRFGSVEPLGPSNKQAAVFVLVMLVLLLFGRPIGRYADSIVAHLQSMISEPAHPATIFPALFWFALWCTSLRWHPQQEDRYRMYFLSLGIFAWTFVAIYPLWHPSVTNTALWRTLNAGWLGISLIAVGIYDHMTLVRLLPNRVEDDHE